MRPGKSLALVLLAMLAASNASANPLETSFSCSAKQAVGFQHKGENWEPMRFATDVEFTIRPVTEREMQGKEFVMGLVEESTHIRSYNNTSLDIACTYVEHGSFNKQIECNGFGQLNIHLGTLRFVEYYLGLALADEETLKQNDPPNDETFVRIGSCVKQ